MVWIKDKENEIHFTRGDSGSFLVSLFNKDGSAYTMGANDTITFSMRNDRMVVLTKTFTSNQITITPSDTKLLACQPYRYEVELHSGDNVYTVIAWSVFVLEREVI